MSLIIIPAGTARLSRALPRCSDDPHSPLGAFNHPVSAPTSGPTTTSPAELATDPSTVAESASSSSVGSSSASRADATLAPSGSTASLSGPVAVAPPLGASSSKSTGSLYKTSVRRPKSLTKLLGLRRDSQTVRSRYTEVDDSKLPTGVSMFQLQQGGCLSERVVEADHTVVVGEEILYVGIIDILIPYETYKQGEHLLKSIVSDGKQISVVPPDEYGPRFQKFVCDSIC